MEETNDVIPVNEKKILASLGYYITSSFVASNNEDLKILKDMADFYFLRYKRKRNTKQMQSNYSRWINGPDVFQILTFL